MSAEPTTKKSPLAIIQSIFVLLTPFLVIGFGWVINKTTEETEQKLRKMEIEVNAMKTKMETKIAPVSAMKPFMDMLSDSTNTKNIMGAYGIYMLKKGEDSRIAAQMIAATQKDHLVDILRTIGKDDDSVQKVLDEIIDNSYGLSPLEYMAIDENNKDTLKLSDLQKYALEVKAKIELSEIRDRDYAVSTIYEGNRESEDTKMPDGWIYLGILKDGLIVDTPNKAGLKTKTYKLRSATNLRINKPKAPNYKLARKIKIIPKSTEVKIDTFTIDGTGHYWASIIIQDPITKVADLFSSHKQKRTTAANEIISGWNTDDRMLQAILDRTENCQVEKSSSEDCSNGIYNAFVVLSNFQVNLLSSHRPEIEEIWKKVPETDERTIKKGRELLKKFQ